MDQQLMQEELGGPVPECLGRQRLFREVNDQIARLHASGLGGDGRLEVLCECADLGCTDLIALTESEYRAVRAVPTRFFVRTGHERSGGAATVAARREGYLVVQTRDEAADAPLLEGPECPG